MNWPFLSRATAEADARENRRVAEMDALRGEVRDLHDELRAERARFDVLFERYHTLRVAGANTPEPMAPVVTSPMADLGPLTRAALAEMANGQSGAVVRAMRTKALALWAKHKNDSNADELVAKAVWAGEAVNLS